MAAAATNNIRKYFSTEIPIEIEVVKEPNTIATGTASGIM